MFREVQLLRAGACRIDRSQLVTGTPEGTMVRIPIWMYLLRGRDSLMLVDTGMPPELIGNERYFADAGEGDQILPQMTPEDTLERVLGRQGLRIENLDAVISTHWHFDHAGGSRQLGSRPVLVHPDELASARAEAELPFWVDPALDFRPARDGDHPMPGVTLLHSPGHTPGHLSLLLEPEGAAAILLTIDAAYTAQNWREDVPGAMLDPVLGLQSVARLKAIAKDASARVFFGHDAAQAEEEFWRALAR